MTSMSPCHLVLSTRRALAIILVSFLHNARSSTASLSSARFIPDIVSISSIHLLIGWPFFFPLRMPASYPFPYHLLSSRGQRTSTSVLLPSVSATYLLLHVQSPSVVIHLFSSQSRSPSASFSISTFRRHQFSSPLLLSLSMSHNHRVSPERSLHLQFLFLSADSRV